MVGRIGNVGPQIERIQQNPLPIVDMLLFTCSFVKSKLVEP